MKHFGKLAASTVLAGALALNAAPASYAQSSGETGAESEDTAVVCVAPTVSFPMSFPPFHRDEEGVTFSYELVDEAEVRTPVEATPGDGVLVVADLPAGEYRIITTKTAAGQSEDEMTAPVIVTEDDATKCPTTTPDEAGSSVGTLLPALVTIGGILWFLNQDGSTYVSSQERVDQVPTPEEKEASDQLKEENAEQISAQGNVDVPATGQTTPNTPAAPAQNDPNHDATGRGVSASTGDNTAAQGLFALAIAALLGIAAFVTRRFAA